MLRYIEQKILQIKKATGVEIILLSDEEFSINSTTVFLKKNKVVKEKTSTGLKSIKELAEKIDVKLPLSIVINGKGVLTKKIPDFQKNSSIQSIIPGSNPNDFYFENYSNGTVSIGSAIRKETLDKILKDLKNQGLKPISVSLGLSVLNKITPFLELNNTLDIETGSFNIKLNDNKELLDFTSKSEINIEKYQSEEFRIADQYIKPLNLLSFAAALNCISDDLKTNIPISSEWIISQRSEYRYYKLFRTLGIGILSLFLLILLINFSLYNYYFKKNQTLQYSQIQNLDQQKKIKELRSKVNKKEKFLEKSGCTNTSKTSYYADRIASITPVDVLLTSLNIYPAKTNSETENGNTLFKKDTILINGVCQDPAELNTFINNLKIISDFNEVALKNYQYRNEKESGIFSIETITRRN